MKNDIPFDCPGIVDIDTNKIRQAFDDITGVMMKDPHWVDGWCDNLSLMSSDNFFHATTGYIEPNDLWMHEKLAMEMMSRLFNIDTHWVHRTADIGYVDDVDRASALGFCLANKRNKNKKKI